MSRRACGCGRMFDTESPEKKKAGGKFSECPECSVETTEKVTGAMIYDHKTAPSLQINAATPEGRSLTEFMNRGVRGQRASPPTTHGAVVKLSDVAQSRRGDVPEIAKTEAQPKTAFAATPSWQPQVKPAPTTSVQAVWYDATERKVYRVMNGVLYSADVPRSLE